MGSRWGGATTACVPLAPRCSPAAAGLCRRCLILCQGATLHCPWVVDPCADADKTARQVADIAQEVPGMCATQVSRARTWASKGGAVGSMDDL